MALTLVFVHGYSVTNLKTYGELPLRLRAEAIKRGITDLRIEEIFLGRYISFDDAVVLDDVSRALQTALRENLKDPDERFMCITHSTGGPVVRNWWRMYYNDQPDKCPMSHLVMLAPANFGSALAQLGKGTLSRLKSWFDGVEPGQGVLNWLELGSAEAWALNVDWIRNGAKQITDKGVFPFVLIGQDIDRKLYDYLNSYTGEIGSDGVVRSAAANLQSRYIRLTQGKPAQDTSRNYQMNELAVTDYVESTAVPFRIVSHKSHGGSTMGIMNSVLQDLNDTKSAETVDAIFRCFTVTNLDQYKALGAAFETETKAVQNSEKVEVEKALFKDRIYIHDRFSMVIFRIMDTTGRPVTDFDLLLTAGPNSDPNQLPEGFFADRQCNKLNRNMLTYFFNYDIMTGSVAIYDSNRKLLREALSGAQMLGLQLRLRPDKGFVQYVACEFKATADMLQKAMHPNGTTLIDICVQRIVDKEVFRFELVTGTTMPVYDFKKVQPGKDPVD